MGLFAPGDRVVVAGAGMGWVAACIAQRVGTENVLGVEDEHLADLVQQNVEVDGVPLTVLWGALNTTGHPARFAPDPDLGAVAVCDHGPVMVPGVSLPAADRAGLGCLALDVEGAEVDILTARSHRAAQVDDRRAHVLVDTAPLAARLKESGLRQTAVRSRTGPVVTFEAWQR